MGRIGGRRVMEMGARAVMVAAAAQQPREVQANPHLVRRESCGLLKKLLRLLEGGPVAQQHRQLEHGLNVPRVVVKDAPEHRYGFVEARQRRKLTAGFQPGAQEPRIGGRRQLELRQCQLVIAVLARPHAHVAERAGIAAARGRHNRHARATVLETGRPIPIGRIGLLAAATLPSPSSSTPRRDSRSRVACGSWRADCARG